MKKDSLFVMLIAAALSLGACNGETEKTATETETVNKSGTANESVTTESTGNTGTTSIKNMDKSPERTQMIKKRRAELEKLTPIDKAKFESWVPETLGDLKRTLVEFKVSPVLGEVSYMNKENGKNIEISIFDGAGKDGGFRFGSEADYTGYKKEGFEEKTEYEINQVRKRNGEYSDEVHYNNDNSSKIRTIVDDRYIVSASGNKMSTDELWKYIESMNFENLK